MSRFVYFLTPTADSGPIKIGSSVNPQKRCKELQAASRRSLKVAAVCAGGYEVERRFHALFIGQHCGNEWFHQSADLLAAIDAISAGAFDFETLPAPYIIPQNHKSRARSAETRAKQSLSLLVSHAEKRSGYLCRVNVCAANRLGDQAGIARAHQFLSDPAAFGIRMQAA